MKYLDHNFIQHKIATVPNRPNLYDHSYMICERCKVIVMDINTLSENGKLLISNYWSKTLGQNNIELNLSCDEILIKKMVE